MNILWPTFHDLMVAYKSCRLNKRPSRSQINFETRLGKNLTLLLEEIHSRRYRPEPTKYFVVTEPKPREIFASDFKDRVVHHLVVSQLEAVWEKKFIYSSFACRKGKGSYRAIRYAQANVRSLSQGGNRLVWALQMDVEKFFITINRTILRDLLLRHAKHPNLRALIQLIYSCDARLGARRGGNPSHFSLIGPGKSWFDHGPDQGIAIGNLSSQFAANAILTGLDHFVLRQLAPNAYLRYMDDILLLDVDPRKLEKMIAQTKKGLSRNLFAITP